jgi:predicted nuclease of predicted toxin-antitoxin system
VSLGLYMDVHVPAAITRALVLRGVDVLTAQLDGTTKLDDAVLLDRATTLGRVLFSQDEDLLAEATKRQRSGQTFGGVIYAHQLGITIGNAINDLEILAQAGTPAEFVNRVEYLPL